MTCAPTPASAFKNVMKTKHGRQAHSQLTALVFQGETPGFSQNQLSIHTLQKHPRIDLSSYLQDIFTVTFLRYGA